MIFKYTFDFSVCKGYEQIENIIEQARNISSCDFLNFVENTELYEKDTLVFSFHAVIYIRRRSSGMVPSANS